MIFSLPSAAAHAAQVFKIAILGVFKIRLLGDANRPEAATRSVGGHEALQLLASRSRKSTGRAISVASASPSSGSLIIRNRWPSADT